MKFTSEDLMKAMGIQVGDRVRSNKILGTVFEVIKMNDESIALNGLQTEWHPIHELIDKEIEILPRPKRVGDLKCDEKCNTCPLRVSDYCSIFNSENVPTLYIILESFKDRSYFYQEIYDLLKTRLDKEVEDE